MNVTVRSTQWKTAAPAGKSREIRGVVLHHTGTPRLVSCSENGSWHYIVDRDGSVYNDIPEGDIAWHTARCDRWRPNWVERTAPWFSGSDVNTCTIGIEIVCHPDLPSADGYEYQQLVSLYDLFDSLAKKYGGLHYVGHGMVQKDRRIREPEGFEWEGFESDAEGKGYVYSWNPYRAKEKEEEMTDTQRGILAAAERQGLKEEADIDQLVGRYNLLAEQVESLEHLLAEAQAERDAAIAAKEAASGQA